MRFLPLLAVWVPLGLWGCGGDVVVDGSPTGSGGSGASSSGTNPSTGAQGPDTATAGPGPGPTSAGPGVTTGPQTCSCTDGCAKLVECGNAVDCDEVCASADPQVEAILQCVCSTQSCDFESCFDPMPDSCVECISQPFGTCDAQIESCVQTDGCLELANCHGACDFDHGCVQDCDMEFPQATGAAYNLLSCAVCQVCFDSCPSAAIDLYCFAGGD
ncbi:MAG: hypothetical protein WKG00_09040 [Polyangiaceae bacterium]